MIFDVQKSNVFCHKALLWESETREIHSCPNVTILTKAAIASKNRRPLTGATSIYVRQQTLFFCSTSFGANDSTIPCVITQSGRGHNMGGVQIEAPSVHYWHLVVNFTTFITKFWWKVIYLFVKCSDCKIPVPLIIGIQKHIWGNIVHLSDIAFVQTSEDNSMILPG